MFVNDTFASYSMSPVGEVIATKIFFVGESRSSDESWGLDLGCSWPSESFE